MDSTSATASTTRPRVSTPKGSWPTASKQSTCLDAFEAFVGVPYEESELEVYYYYPFEDTWNHADDRTISCTVGTLTGRTTGTLEGSNR